MRQIKDSATVWRELNAASKKTKGGLYTRYINRNAAKPMTWLLWKLGFAPNAVSILSFLLTHAALAVLIFFGPAIPAAIGAYALLVLGYMLDSCDGQLARVTGRTSALGEWLDHSLDIVKLININLALGYVTIMAAAAEGASLTLPFLAAWLNVLAQPAHFFVVNMKCALFEANPALTGESSDAPKDSAGPASRGGLIERAVLFLADYGIFIMIVLLLPWQELFVPVYLAYGVFALALLVLHFLRTSLTIARRG